MNVLIFGGKGWIGNQFVELLLSKGITYHLATSRPGDQPDAKIEEELNTVKPSHVICFIGRTHGGTINTIEYLEGGPDKLNENVRDNLYGPWLLAAACLKQDIHFTYVGTGCVYQYDTEHPIGGKGYTEEDMPNYFGNSYSVVKGHTDRMMHHFPNVFNVRVRLPVNYKNEKRNLVTKVVGYKKIMDVPNSLTILPEILPAMLDLMGKKYTGTLNMVNPGPIMHSQTLSYYNELKGGGTPDWQVIAADHPDGQRMMATRANCALDTSKLESLCPGVRPAIDGIREAVKAIVADSK